MLNKTLTLLSNASATGNEEYWPGGTGVMKVEATWGGGTVKLQTKSANGSWVDVGAAVTFTANGVGGFVLSPGPIRANVATATAVYATVQQVPTLD